MTAFCDLCFTKFPPHKAGDNSVSDLAGLVERLEKATGPDRELDGQIEAALGCPCFSGTLPTLSDGWRWTFEADDAPGRVTVFLTLANKTSKKHKRYAAPAYTSSVDAAMTLVPEGFAVSVEWSPRHPGSAWLYPPDNFNDISFEAEAASPALALCAAALKTRSPQP